MNLSSFDGKTVRILFMDGEIFDGECVWQPAEFCDAEIGRDEDALQIDNWLFFRSEIRSVQILEDGVPRLWKSRPVHYMRLSPEAFRLAEKGQKIIELRLWDKKRRKIRQGDVIRFEETDDDTEILYVLVTGLGVYDSFAELYRALPLRDCGYTEKTIAAASPEDMRAYYTSEEEKRWGVAGIRFEAL